MPRPDFRGLRNELLGTGVAPAHVTRTITELSEHYQDLVDMALDTGQSRHEAERCACLALGDLGEVASIIGRQSEFKSWAWRFPKLAVIIYPLACLAALPAVPVIAGVQNAAEVARWAAGLAAGALVTAAIFLVLQLSILLA
jgi:hypothetical protein